MRGSYDINAEAWGVGVQVRYPLALLADVALTGEYVFADMNGTSGWQVDLDLTTGVILPGLHAGGGVALARRPFLLVGMPIQERQTRAGFTLLVGGTLPPFIRLPVRPRLELRWTFVKDFDTQAQVSLGASVRLGRPPPVPPRPRG